MATRRCRFCRAILQGEPEEIGARCPECRRALYERPNDGVPVAELVERDLCVVHVSATAVGTCPRCGNFLCDVCRTRWRGRWLCVACVERALAAGEVPSEEESSHRRQAILGVVFGGAAWLLAILSVLILSLGSAENKLEAVSGVVLLTILAFPCAATGLGQAAAAVRARGDHLIWATAGLLLSGLYFGMLLGYLGVSLWQD